MCEPENIIGPKGKTSESDNIDVVIHDTSENLSANKREYSDRIKLRDNRIKIKDCISSTFHGPIIENIY